MRFSLLPWVIADRVTELTVEFLHQEEIELLMLDFDNTIVPYTTNEPAEDVAAWLTALKASDIHLCVVSNSHKDRVKIFCEAWGIDCITHARKPFRKGIWQCMVKYGIPPDHCALVGDQIFTDTLGANRTGVNPILVRAIHNHNIWLKLRHVAELPFIAMADKRRLK